MPRMSTLCRLTQQIKDLEVQSDHKHNLPVVAVHSASGTVNHINSFYIHTLTEADLKDEFGCFYEDEGLKVGDKVVLLSIGGN